MEGLVSNLVESPGGGGEVERGNRVQGEGSQLRRESASAPRRDLTTNLDNLLAMIPRAESELSYATPRSTLEPILSDMEEELAEPINFQPMVGEGEPAWDEGPENEGEIFDVSSTFFQAPSWLDPNNMLQDNDGGEDQSASMGQTIPYTVLHRSPRRKNDIFGISRR